MTVVSRTVSRRNHVNSDGGMWRVRQVHDYIRNYLGESKQVQTFAQQFLEKRSKLRNAAKPKHEVMVQLTALQRYQ